MADLKEACIPVTCVGVFRQHGRIGGLLMLAGPVKELFYAFAGLRRAPVMVDLVQVAEGVKFEETDAQNGEVIYVEP